MKPILKNDRFLRALRREAVDVEPPPLAAEDRTRPVRRDGGHEAHRVGHRDRRGVAQEHVHRALAGVDAVGHAGPVNRDGVEPRAAGEVENARLQALREQYRKQLDERCKVLTELLADIAKLYPDLARLAPDGVVGDPRGARAERAEAYLGVWVEELAVGRLLWP